MISTAKILPKLIRDVDHAKDLASALDIIVSEVSSVLESEVCSVYLIDRENKEKPSLVLKANVGFNLEAVNYVELAVGEGLVGRVAERSEALNLKDAKLHKQFYACSQIDEGEYLAFLGVPIIEHADVLGVLVVQRKKGSFNDDHEAFLTTLASRLAKAILHAKNYGDVQQKLGSAYGSINLVGGAGAPGICIGNAVMLFDQDHVIAVQNKKSRGYKKEKEVLDHALNQVIAELSEQENIMRGSLPEAEVALFTVYILMLQDGPLLEEAYQGMKDGLWAPLAWRNSVESHAAIFDSMDDPYLAERAQDVRDLGKRVLNAISSAKDDFVAYPQDTILIGENISVNDLARVPTGILKGIVSGHGSKSSHVAILAHALGIPAVMGVANLPSKGLDGKSVVVDGYSGHVYIDPSPQLFASLKSAIDEENLIHKQLDELIDQSATTLDGVDISLYVNAGLMADLSPSLSAGAEGIGLYRTETPFQVRERFPTEAEQYELYRELLEMFEGKPVVLRTLDVGGDKPLKYFPIVEENPFLGWRGIRITLDHPEIFLTQVRAMLRANIGLGNLHILLPMITNRVELDDSVALINRAKDELSDELDCDIDFPKIGVMIEVPAAVYQIEEFCQLVDFVSVGTNDLTQYLLAVDRNNENVANLYSALHPAVLKALQQIVQGALKQNTPVSVCGEMAGDPLGMLLLLGLGIESLSMSVGSIARVKQVIRHFSFVETNELFNQALDLADVNDIRSMLERAIVEKGLGGLIRAGS